MTSQSIKFYKLNSNSSKLAGAKTVEGAIIYVVDARELWIGGSTPKLVIKGANDVTFANNVLTLTNYDNAGAATTQTLDFSDVASANATFKVFDSVWSKMGATTSGTSKVLDYTGTNYLTSATNLVDADKALDTAIYDNTHKAAATGAEYDTQHLSQTWTTVVTNNEIETNDTLDADIDKLDKKVAGLADEVIANEQVTQEAFTSVANSVGLESDMSLDLSTASQTGAIHSDTDVKSALIHLDNAISTNQLDVQVDGHTIVDNHIANINTEDAYNASSNKLATKATVTNAINALDVDEYAQASVVVDTTNHASTLKIKGIKEVDGKIAAATATPTSDVAIDGEYSATDNKIATESTVTNAINALDKATDTGAASISGSTITINAVQQENGLIKDGGSITINLDGTYDATDNKIATKSTVTTAIEALDATNIQGVDYTAADASNGAKLTFKGVSETDGVIAQGTGTDVLQFAKVATTGAAADVSIEDAQSKITATNVEDALTELATNIENLAGGMRYNGDIENTTATLNTSTHDIRPGDIYLVTGAGFTIGTTSVEAGDMIVYKGNTSTSTVTLTSSNCTIIERETDTMVTAGNTLTDDYVVFGNGGKEVTTTSNDSYTISASDLNTAITKANSALQSISKGTDGTYVTTTVGSKDSNNDQSVGVEVKLATVTYTAKSGDTPANLSVAQGNEGVLTDAAITPIKNYVDAKVGTAIQSVDGSATEKAKSVTQSNYAIVKVTANTDANKDVTLDTAVGLTVQAVSTADSSNMGLAEASDVKSYVDGVVNGLDVPEYEQAAIDTTTSQTETTLKIKSIKQEDGEIAAGTSTTDIKLDGTYIASTNKIATQSTVTNAINTLDADITSNDNAVATVEVVETDGKITDVVVTNVSAGVTYTRSEQAGGETGASADLAAGSSAAAQAGAVTGADIAAIKSYVDDKAILCWEEYE